MNSTHHQTLACGFKKSLRCYQRPLFHFNYHLLLVNGFNAPVCFNRVNGSIVCACLNVSGLGGGGGSGFSKCSLVHYPVTPLSFNLQYKNCIICRVGSNMFY